MTLQRYVSKELTHFVGRGLSEEGQYSILVDSILRGGWLRHSPNTTQEPAEILERGGVSLTIDRFAPLSEVYGPQVVCFCDIPVSDLEIHMRKYSRFGLSFLKPFLIEKGANPVYYVAENSRALKWFMGEEPKGVSGYAVTRKLLFEHNVREYIDLFWKLRMGDNPPQWDTGLLVPFPEEHEKIGLLQLLLDSYVFSFVKYFDDTTADEDPENYYMEREWRVLGDVKFELDDVYRAILPRSYAERFRDDLPGYTGQVTFVES